MSEPFLAEVRMMGFNFAPRGWGFCDGQILPINQNQSLYSLLGTIYGGDGRTSFALPDLRSRTPLHVDNEHQQGQKSGAETISLTAAEIPQHTHAFRASSLAGNTRSSTGSILASAPTYRPFAADRNQPLRSGSINNVGGGQAHNNMQPYTTVSFAIALQGLFPSRN